MSTNLTLSPKHQRLLEALANGMTQREAAGVARMHHVTACRVSQRPEFRAELKRLRHESEQVLAERLPDLIRQTLDVLSGEIAFPSERRLRAVKIALDLVARLCAEPVVISSQLSDAGLTVTLDQPLPGEKDLSPVEMRPTETLTEVDVPHS